MEIPKVNKIVYLSQEQYETLLREGQVEVDGEIKNREENTLYVTPNNTYQWLFDKFYETLIKPKEVRHEQVINKSLEEDYETICETIENSSSLSAVGFTCIMHPGDVIKVTEPNKGEFYINGQLVEQDYEYRGEGIEIANVWVFESGSKLNLVDEPQFLVPEIKVFAYSITPELSFNYTTYAEKVGALNYKGKFGAVRDFVSKGQVAFEQAYVGGDIKTLESDCTEYLPHYNVLCEKPTLVKAIFPNLRVIKGTLGQGPSFLNKCTNPKLQIEFPKLTRVENHGNYNLSHFSGVNKVVIPPTLYYMGANTFYNNTEVILNCNKATDISPNAFGNAPANFDMCGDWQASINIAIAAQKRDVNWFIDLFTNKLHDFSATETIKEICIPANALSLLTPEQIAIATNKGWSVSGQ